MAGRQSLAGHENIKGFNKRRLTEGSDISDDDRIRQREDTDQG